MNTQVRVWYVDGTAQVITVGGKIHSKEVDIAIVDVLDAVLTDSEREWLIDKLQDHFTSYSEYRRVVHELYR